MSVEQSEQKYNEMKHRERFPDRMFSAEFIAADCSKVSCSLIGYFFQSYVCLNKFLFQTVFPKPSALQLL